MTDIDADARPLEADELERLQGMLDGVPEPFLPLDVCAIDGFLCGVLLQPHDIETSRWLPCITDVEARPMPAGFDAGGIHALVRRRRQQLQAAIATRSWFDPWVFELEPDASPSECVLPWVAGFAAAMERFPALMHTESPELLEPLALLYLHFDAQDLDDADALQRMIETLEPPADLGEAVQDIVRSVMLLADVTRPRQLPRDPGRGRRQQRR